MSGVRQATCCEYKEACSESRKWIEAATKIAFPCEDFRESLRDGTLLCKLVEKLSGITIGQLNPIPRSLAWMDNLIIFLNLCRYMGLKKSQLFRASDLAAVRNQNITVKVNQKDEDRRLRNVLITIFWLGRLAYSLEDYQGPLPELKEFETLINKNRPPEMVDEQRHKFELDTLSGSGTWPKINRSSRCQEASVKESSLEYFEHMRRQLIPRLTENVKEKAVMYEKIQQEAYLDKRHNEERSRSFSHPKSDDTQLTGKTAKRAHSFGVLNTKRDRTNNEDNIPFYTGSITRRTPVKVSVSNIQREPAKHHLQEPLKNNHNKKSFQYNSKPVVEGKRPSAPARSRNKNDRDYVSVRALIKQWSDPDAKKEVQRQQINEEKCKNRRSLEANFDASDVLLKKKERSSSKSVTETVHNKSKNNMSRSDWSLHAGVSSATNRGSPDRKQDYFVETRTRTKSEPSNYSSTEYDHALVEKYWSSSIINKENRDFKNRERETMGKKSETTQYTSPAISYSQQQSSRKEMAKDMKGRNHFSEQPVCTARKALPLIRKSEVKYVENYMDQKFYQSKKDSAVDGRKLQSNKKYATIPATRTKMNDNKRFSSKKERHTEGNARVNLNDTNRKAEEKSEKTIKHPSEKSSSEQSSLTHRLPTYEEAIIPWQENDLVKEAKTDIDSKKVFEKDYVSVDFLQQKRERDKIKSSTVTAEEYNYSTRKPPVNENFSKQHVTQIYATEVAHPVAPSNKSITRNYEITPKYFYSPRKGESFSSVKKTTAFTNKSHGTLETDPAKSFRDKTQNHDGSSLYVNDVNNNILPVYDGKTLKALLTSQQRMSKNNSSRKNFERNSTSKVEDAFIGEDSKPIREEQHILNDFKQLKEEQKTTLDADFKDRSKTHMGPNIAQQLKSGGGVSLSNIVHEGELLQLVAAEEKYWKDKVGRNEMSTKQKEIKKVENEKQERVKRMLREFKINDQRRKIDYSDITDTLRAEEEFLAQEAEKLLKQRFQEKSAIKPSLTTAATKPLQYDTKQQNNDNMSHNSHFEQTPSCLHSILKTSSRQKKPSSVTSSDDINLKPEADQAYHHKKILRSRSPVYICSGCRLPVEKDICLYVAELQSYWHEKCFRCSVCHSNLIKNEQTPKIRVMFSRIHCENCLSNKKTGGQSTMV